MEGKSVGVEEGERGGREGGREGGKGRQLKKYNGPLTQVSNTSPLPFLPPSLSPLLTPRPFEATTMSRPARATAAPRE